MLIAVRISLAACASLCIAVRSRSLAAVAKERPRRQRLREAVRSADDDARAGTRNVRVLQIGGRIAAWRPLSTLEHLVRFCRQTCAPVLQAKSAKRASLPVLANAHKATGAHPPPPPPPHLLLARSTATAFKCNYLCACVPMLSPPPPSKHRYCAVLCLLVSVADK